jgi:hypothetical protein
VDVAGASRDGLREQRVHEAHHGRLRGRGLVEHAVVRTIDVRDRWSQLGECIGQLRRIAVKAVDRLADRHRARHHDADVEAAQELHLLDGNRDGRIGHRDGERRPGKGDRNELAASGERMRHGIERGARDVGRPWVDDGQAVFVRERFDQHLIGDEATPYQLDGRSARLQRQLFSGEQTSPPQDLSESRHRASGGDADGRASANPRQRESRTTEGQHHRVKRCTAARPPLERQRALMQ